MINNARGSHSSPGLYMREVDVNYSVKSLGITTLGLAGETLKGPAFEAIPIEKWSEYVDYFGGTSTEKFKGTGYPKYELPYIAKEYLKESKKLQVVRVLGLSGYEAGPAWVITVAGGGKTYAAAVLRSKGTFDDPGEAGCEKAGEGDELSFETTSITVTGYTKYVYGGNCEVVTASTETETLVISKENLGKFTLKITTDDGKSTDYPVSLNYGDRDYIYTVFGSDPLSGSAPVFVEAFYDYALKELVKDDKTTYTIQSGVITPEREINNYHSRFDCAKTPWFLSEVKSDGGSLLMKELFRVYTISDGKAANKQVKISIQNIKPDNGTFDLLVRQYNDSDSSPIIMEKFSKCDLIPGSPNFLPLRVGTIDGEYELKSKYIAIEMAEDVDEIAGSVPCGFEGYPLHNYAASANMPIAYNTKYDPKVKARRQYFGLSDKVGVDEDILSYKGVNTVLSKGFHLDSILSEDYTGINNKEILVNGKEGYEFTAVSPLGLGVTGKKIPRIITEKYMEGTIYEDVNLRKFTVYPAGGFDGWDIYRTERTNGDKFNGNHYGGASYGTDNIESWMDLPSYAINSDYYAFLAGYRQFANPEAVDINIFATPGIDFVNNELLVEDALDVIEDTDDGRRGDALYIITTPNKPSGSEYTDAEEDMYTPQEVVDALDNSSIDTSYGATYWPWLKCFDSEDNKYIYLPPTKDVVRNMAYTDNNSYPWFSPAGILRGNTNCVKAAKNLKIADEDTLYDGLINPVKTFAVDGVKIWGNKTMYSVDSPLNRVNVRRLMLRVKKLVSAVGKQLIFEQYDASLKNQFLSLVTPILSDVKANRGISDYRIDIDDSLEARDAHTLPCTIHIKPTPTLEWIDLTFTIYPESVDFAE